MAVRQNLPVFGSTLHAGDIADPESLCTWVDDMMGVDMSKPGAQAYYDSIVALYAEWGVDYIKADDMISPYHGAEIEGLSNAIKRAKRKIVLSLSPGPDLSTEYAEHLKQYSELWRISADFWDRWDDLKKQFDICGQWAAHITPGAWPDADMLPLGHIGIRAERGIDRASLLTHDEQIMLMSLWAIFRSPLMFGGDLPTSDAFTINLLTNAEVMAINQTSCANRELLRQGDLIAWAADRPDSDDKYLALFNIGGGAPALIKIKLSLLGTQSDYEVHDVWTGVNLGVFRGNLQERVAPHSAKLYRLRPLPSNGNGSA